MLNFNDMFMHNTTSDFKPLIAICLFVVIFIILGSLFKSPETGAAILLAPLLIMIGVALSLPYRDSRDVYVAIDNPPFEISDFCNSEGASVKKINDKYYFSGVVLLRNYKSTKELEDRIESSYKLYLDEIHADKNKKKYQEAIQEFEEKGNKINGIKKG